MLLNSTWKTLLPPKDIHILFFSNYNFKATQLSEISMLQQKIPILYRMAKISKHQILGTFIFCQKKLLFYFPFAINTRAPTKKENDATGSNSHTSLFSLKQMDINYSIALCACYTPDVGTLHFNIQIEREKKYNVHLK